MGLVFPTFPAFFWKIEPLDLDLRTKATITTAVITPNMASKVAATAVPVETPLFVATGNYIT
jgi:hypothetical protein